MSGLVQKASGGPGQHIDAAAHMNSEPMAKMRAIVKQLAAKSQVHDLAPVQLQ